MTKTTSKLGAQASGRPPFQPTSIMRRVVEELVACGEKQKIIAAAVGITAPTLRLHFADELANGLAKRRAEVIALLFRQARKGNVAAIKRLEEITSMESALANRKPSQRSPGKKELLNAQAQSAHEGTDWADLVRN